MAQELGKVDAIVFADKQGDTNGVQQFEAPMGRDPKYIYADNLPNDTGDIEYRPSSDYGWQSWKSVTGSGITEIDEIPEGEFRWNRSGSTDGDAVVAIIF